MPNMAWEDFQDTHFRPHLVVAQMSAGTGRAEGRSTLERLVEALGVIGNYSLKEDGRDIQVAFEIDSDAERFAGVLLAKGTTRDPEWASRAVGHVDRAARKRIADALRRQRLGKPRRRG